MRPETTPIIPNFSKARDRKQLLDLKRKRTTRGVIRTNTHRVIVVATKIATVSAICMSCIVTSDDLFL